ncbi:hypothetical protein NDU88_006241 [Pleurodeles waltl]|uniref:Uncharacterized protein n=1 Tax=Pleurodeles waltl TaxID=8319 RepID=A0AAV7TDL5_PLEWA|nr:hypothetical protein NDU88_006241 [Pleurodeles waltl]
MKISTGGTPGTTGRDSLQEDKCFWCQSNEEGKQRPPEGKESRDVGREGAETRGKKKEDAAREDLNVSSQGHAGQKIRDPIASSKTRTGKGQPKEKENRRWPRVVRVCEGAYLEEHG